MTTPTIEKTAAATDHLPVTRDELIALMRNVYQEERNAAGKKVISLDEIREEFRKLPGEEDREYELAIARFARDWADFVIKKQDPDDPEPSLLQLLPKPGQTLVYGTDEEKFAFAAFAVAVNYERLQKNPDEEGNLLNQYRDVFGKKHRINATTEKHEHVYFFHLDVLFRMDMAVGANDDFLMELLEDARTNSINLSKNHGGQHAYAETVALVFENASDQLRKELKNDPKAWLEEARTAVIEAIAADKAYSKKKNPNKEAKPYAKYFCTRARIQALRGDLENAIIDVNTAIANEDNTRTDYSIRIGQYSSYYQQFRAQQNLLRLQDEALANQMEEMRLAMEAQEKETMAKSMEFLGLFSGIVSFTIGSLTITGAIAEQSIKHAAGLIVVLLGALMCVFAAFGMILHGFHVVRRNKKTQKFERSFMCRHLIVFILGALVVLGGIYFCLN